MQENRKVSKIVAVKRFRVGTNVIAVLAEGVWYNATNYDMNWYVKELVNHGASPWFRALKRQEEPEGVELFPNANWEAFDTMEKELYVADGNEEYATPEYLAKITLADTKLKEVREKVSELQQWLYDNDLYEFEDLSSYVNNTSPDAYGFMDGHAEWLASSHNC